MGRFSNGRCQEVDLEMLEKPMERFPQPPWLENEVLRDQYQNLDSSAFLALESGVLPGQYPSLDPYILDLKSGKEHQWIDYQWKDFEDLFNQRYRGTKVMVKFFCNTLVRHLQAGTAKVISSLALKRGVKYQCHGIHCDAGIHCDVCSYPNESSDHWPLDISWTLEGQCLVWDSKFSKKMFEEEIRGRYQISNSKNFEGALQGWSSGPLKEEKGDGSECRFSKKMFEEALGGLYQISISKNFKGALQGWSSGPLKEEKGDGSECRFSKKMFEEALGGLYQISISKNFKGALQGGTSGPPKEEKGDGSECQDAEGERSRSGTSQDLDGGVESSSSESQGPDRGEGSASVENQGGDGNSEGNGSGDGEDEHQGGLDVENRGQENNQEEIDIPRNETNMAIISTATIAAVDFHYNGFISTTILGLLTAINAFAFLCCMTSMWHRHRNPRAARKFGTIGAAAGSFGFLLLVSVPFSGYYPWVILILGSLAILVIFVLAFKP